MGLFCVNFHFRTNDDRALRAVLDRRGVSRYRVLPEKGGWTSLYEEQASRQDEQRIRDLASGLSKDMHVAAIAFLVHDSDIACYWLYENGRMLDEYNSCPHYFDDDATADGPPSPSGGLPDVLLRYCRSGVREDELAAIIAQETTFAEAVIEQLAEALGIERERAIADYRDMAGGEGPEGMDGDDGDDGDGDDGGGPNILALRQGMAERVAQMLGSDPRGTKADPQVIALVQAAARGDLHEIDRLLADGVAIDSEGPAPLPEGQPTAGLSKLLPGGMPRIAMTPLLAAVINKQRPAAERLLQRGADPKGVHLLFGTPLHAAAGAGNEDLLQLLIDRGGNVNARNHQGQTPLQVVAASRTTLDRLSQAQELMKSMGMNLPGLVDQLSKVTMPTEGWNECERLLKAHGAR
jgi:hypothetical protein